MSSRSEDFFPLIFYVEILGSHAVRLSPIERADHDPGDWYDAFKADWPEGGEEPGLCVDVEEARQLARRLREELGIPTEAVRIRRVEQTLVDLEVARTDL